MSKPGPIEVSIRALFDAKIFDRGLTYYRSGAVSALVRRGDNAFRRCSWQRIRALPGGNRPAQRGRGSRQMLLPLRLQRLLQAHRGRSD